MEKLTNTYELESELANLLKLIEDYESLDSVDFQQLIEANEPEPNEESTETSESELTMGGRRYPLRERTTPT